jgi:hypothetical protein
VAPSSGLEKVTVTVATRLSFPELEDLNLGRLASHPFANYANGWGTLSLRGPRDVISG